MPMNAKALLTLIAPVYLEEILVDWLLEHSPEGGFCSGPVNGHATGQQHLTLSEQVAGRKRQIRFEVHAGVDEIQTMIESLHRDHAGARIHYWVVPVSGAGKV
jgi:hypothetical protein